MLPVDPQVADAIRLRRSGEYHLTNQLELSRGNTQLHPLLNPGRDNTDFLGLDRDCPQLLDPGNMDFQPLEQDKAEALQLLDPEDKAQPLDLEDKTLDWQDKPSLDQEGKVEVPLDSEDKVVVPRIPGPDKPVGSTRHGVMEVGSRQDDNGPADEHCWNSADILDAVERSSRWPVSWPTLSRPGCEW